MRLFKLIEITKSIDYNKGFQYLVIIDSNSKNINITLLMLSLFNLLDIIRNIKYLLILKNYLFDFN